MKNVDLIQGAEQNFLLSISHRSNCWSGPFKWVMELSSGKQNIRDV